jgi:hypothetical protein
MYRSTTRRSSHPLLRQQSVEHDTNDLTVTEHVTPNHMTLNHVTPNHVTPNHMTINHVTPNHVTPNHVTSNHVTPNHVTRNNLNLSTFQSCVRTESPVYTLVSNGPDQNRNDKNLTSSNVQAEEQSRRLQEIMTIQEETIKILQLCCSQGRHSARGGQRTDRTRI